MVRCAISCMLAMLTGQALAQPQPRTGGATTSAEQAFVVVGPVPHADLYAPATGRIRLSVEDRVLSPTALRGDVAELEAELTVGADTYEVELTQTGSPPGAIVPPSPIGGGVMLEVDLHGDSGLGYWTTTRVHAGIVVWGLGTLRRNGAVVTEQAWVMVSAAIAGSHADDDTHRLLPRMREKDGELTVLLTQLPRAVVSSGFMQFEMEELELEVDGKAVALDSFVPTVPSLRPEETGPLDISSRSVWLLPGPGGSAPSSSVPVPSDVVGQPGVTPGFSLETELPPGIPPANTEPASPLPESPPPENAEAAEPLVTQPSPSNAEPAGALVPGIPPTNVAPAPQQVPAVPPSNAQPADALPPAIPPSNAAPATPLPTTPPPANSAPVGGSSAPGG